MADAAGKASEAPPAARRLPPLRALAAAPAAHSSYYPSCLLPRGTRPPRTCWAWSAAGTRDRTAVGRQGCRARAEQGEGSKVGGLIKPSSSQSATAKQQGGRLLPLHCAGTPFAPSSRTGPPRHPQPIPRLALLHCATTGTKRMNLLALRLPLRCGDTCAAREHPTARCWHAE